MPITNSQYIWFGIPGKQMQWVPAPQAGFQRNWVYNSAVNQLADGRQAITQSNQAHSQFSGTYIGDYTDNVCPQGVDVFQAYASGFYGSGSVTFANPYAMQQNMFPPSWATPSLARYGWANMTGGTITYPAVASSNNRPKISYNATVTGSPLIPFNTNNRYNQYLAIPPGYTLYIGWSGSTTGTAAIMVQPYNTDNSLAPAQILNPIAPTSSTQTNASFSGNIYNAVRVIVTRTTSVASSIQITSMMARMYPNTQAAPTQYDHVPGQGHSGLAISADSYSETYDYASIRKSLTLTLEEVI